MKIKEVVEIWDKLNNRDTGDIGFCDLEQAIDEVVGVDRDPSVFDFEGYPSIGGEFMNLKKER